MIPALEEATSSNCTFSQASSSKKEMAHSDEIRFLDYLGTDFSYLRRFILASHQMVRLVQTEAAQSNLEVQEKVVDTIEIAKETLSEAGASARPFIPCPTDLVCHREAYFKVLSAARSLVPYVEDPVVKLRLRRLLLPLTSTSRFRVVLPIDPERSKADNSTPLPTWWDDVASTSKATSSVPNPSALPRPAPLRRKTRRTSTSAVIRVASSPSPYSSCASDSTSRMLTSRSSAGSRRPKASPYPNPAQLVIRRPNATSTNQKDGEVTASHISVPEGSSTPSSTSPPPEVLSRPPPETTASTLPHPSEPPPSPKPNLPPIAYVSPQTPKALSLLQQQHRDFRAGYPAYRKPENDLSSGHSPAYWDTAQLKASLAGVNCNIADDNYGALPSNIEVFSREEYDEANENFRKGLGWFPTRWRNQAVSQANAAPKSPPELTWTPTWDDNAKHQTQPSEPFMTLLPSYPPDGEEETPLAESTCIIM